MAQKFLHDITILGSDGSTATIQGAGQSTLNLKTTTNSKNNYIVGSTTGSLSFRPNGTETLTLNSSQNATFAGAVSVNSKFIIANNGTATWGGAADYGQLTWDTGYALIYGQSGKGIKFGTNGSTLALTLDTSQNATFAGNILIGSTATTDAKLNIVADGETTNFVKLKSTKGTGVTYGLKTNGTNSDVLAIMDITAGNRIAALGNNEVSFNIAGVQKLGINSSGNATFAGSIQSDDITIVDGTNDVNLYFANTSYAIQLDYSAGDMLFRTNGAPRLTISNSGNATFAGDIAAVNANITTAIDVGSFVYVGGNNSIFAENNLRFKSAGAAYIDHNTVGQSIKFRLSNSSSLDVTPLEITPSYLSSTVDMYFGDNDKIRIGAGSDLQIYHDGSNSYIAEVGTGDLIISGGNDIIFKDAVGNLLVNMNQSDRVELYFGGSKKFETYSTGAGVTGNLYFTSGSKIHFDNGVSNDYYIEKSGTALTFNTGGTYVFNTGNATFAGNITTTGLQVNGATYLDVMPDHQSEGIIRIGRYDANTSRYHDIKSYVSSTAASNYLKFSLHGGTENAVADVLTLKGDLSATFAGNITANNFSGSSEGTNTGDQTLPTASSLGAVTITGTQTISGAKTFSNTSNHYNGHLFFDAYSAGGDHYPHFLDGSSNSGATINWRQYYGSNYKTHTWTSDASGNMGFTYQGAIIAVGSLTATGLDINGNADISGNLSGVDTLTATTLSVTNYGLASSDIPNNAANTTGSSGSCTGNAATATSASSAAKLTDGGGISTHPGTNNLIYTGALGSTVSGLFTASDNSNSILTVNRHTGDYNSQLGFSSNGNLYYRKFSGSTAYTTQGWKTLAFTDTDITGDTTGNAATATNVAYSGLTGTVPTWNQNTTGSSGSCTGNAATATTASAVAWGNITSRPYIEAGTVTSATATTTVASVVHATYTAAFFDFVIKNGTNVRSGTVYACHDGTTVSFTETSTVDLGDTSDVTLNARLVSTNMVLEAITTSSTWTIKTLTRAI